MRQHGGEGAQFLSSTPPCVASHRKMQGDPRQLYSSHKTQSAEDLRLQPMPSLSRLHPEVPHDPYVYPNTEAREPQDPGTDTNPNSCTPNQKPQSTRFVHRPTSPGPQHSASEPETPNLTRLEHIIRDPIFEKQDSLPTCRTWFWHFRSAASWGWVCRYSSEGQMKTCWSQNYWNCVASKTRKVSSLPTSLLLSPSRHR